MWHTLLNCHTCQPGEHLLSGLSRRGQCPTRSALLRILMDSTSAPPPSGRTLSGSGQKNARANAWALGFIDVLCFNATSSACAAQLC